MLRMHQMPALFPGVLFFFILLFKVYLVLREREIKNEWGEEQREMGSERLKQAPC